MHVVGARQPPELLPGDVGPAEQRMARQVAPAVAVRVDRQLAEAAELDHADQPDRVQARHQAGGAVREQQVVAPAHLVEVAGEVEGEHGLLAGAVGLRRR